MSETTHTISEAQLAANRENAKKSCGPVTPEGKAKSSLNAVKCGLTGTTVLLPGDDHYRYQLHIRDYELQFQPVGPEEKALVQSIADIRWRLNRIPGLELAILGLSKSIAIEENPHFANRENEMLLELHARRQNEKELRNLQLNENRLSRRRERETAELERRQATRKGNEEESLATAAKSKLLALHNNQTNSPIPGFGFEYSKTRFTTYMDRLTPAQRAKFLQDAITESVEAPKTQEAVA